MVSVTSDNKLMFRNVGGYLSFKLYGEGVSVKRITLKGNNGEKLAGKATITMPVDGTPTVEMQQDITESITLTCETPVVLGSDADHYTEFWLVVPPTSFSQGFTVTVTDALGGTFIKKTTNELVIERNKLARMAPLKVVPESSGNIPIPDAQFKAYCINHFDKDDDGEISRSEALQIERIEVETDHICTFAGIEFFPNLRELKAEPRHTGEYGVGIGEDWRNSGYTFDEYNGYNTVSVVHGKLNVLDLSGNPLLETLDCSGNALKSVDLTANPNLKEINLKYNPDLSVLKLGNVEKVHTLELTCTSLTSIDVSVMPELKYLVLDRGESLSSGTIDVSHNSKLEALRLDRRGITHLNVSLNPQLRELRCSMNEIAAIDLSNNENLEDLFLSFNQIQNLSVSKNCKLTSLMLQNNKLSSLDITMLPDLQSVHIGNNVKDETTPVNKISEIDLSANSKLERFFSSILDINDIDLSTSVPLKECR